MRRKIRYPLVVLLLLLAVLTGVTLRQVHQTQLNRALLTVLHDDENALLQKDKKRLALKALAALKAGADPNCWAVIGEKDRLEWTSWPEWFPLNLWPFGRRRPRAYVRRSALTMAIFSDDPEPVKALLDQGADLHRKIDEPPEGVLDAAIRVNNEEVVNLLLDHGANINEWASTGPPVEYATVLMFAARDNPDMALLLIHRGANMNLKSKNGWTALDWALSVEPPNPPNKKYFEMIRLLKAAGAQE